MSKFAETRPSGINSTRMQIVARFDEVNLTQGSYITLGAFDGLHLGHQALIGGMVENAHANGHAAVVVTFTQHPALVLGKREQFLYLTSPDEKMAELARLGVDVVVNHPFTLAVSKLTAGDFLDAMLRHLHPRAFCVGYDFAIGHNREGNLPWLKQQSAQHNFIINQREPLSLDGEIVSSSRVRRALQAGEVEDATRLLGRPFRLSGPVIAGQQRGRTIGFPTANLRIAPDRAFPIYGVYACWATLADDPTPYMAAVNIGVRPTFGEGLVSVEAHLLDYSGNLYDREVTLSFVAHLRPEIKFTGLEALMTQIHADVAETRRRLAATPLPTP